MTHAVPDDSCPARSGLDAAVSFDILSMLKRLSYVGMNMLMVIHQPRFSIFTMFDSVLLLGNGGRTVFLGPAQMALVGA